MIYTVVFLGDGWSFISESVQVIVIEMLLSLAIFWCDITYWTFFVDLLFYPIQDYFYVALEMILFCFAGGGGCSRKDNKIFAWMHECHIYCFSAYQSEAHFPRSSLLYQLIYVNIFGKMIYNFKTSSFLQTCILLDI